MEKFSFFNSIDDDRIYYAEDFARHLKQYFTNGIFNNGLQVTSNNDMTITIKEGDANIEGYRYTNTNDLIKTIETADGVLNRIDNVVIRLDLTNRLISAQIIKGTFDENPVPPNLERSSTVFDIKLAQISVPAGTTEITQDLITDTRFDENVCGNVIGAVQQIDTNDIFNQYQTIFDNWFQSLEDELSENQAGNLQNQINSLKSQSGIDNKYNICELNENNIYTCNLSKTLENGTILQLFVPFSDEKNLDIDDEIKISIDNGSNSYNLQSLNNEINMFAKDFNFKDTYLKVLYNGTSFKLLDPKIVNEITAYLQSDVTFSSNSNYVALNTSVIKGKQGNAFSVAPVNVTEWTYPATYNGIKIGAGISKIKVNANIQFKDNEESGTNTGNYCRGLIYHIRNNAVLEIIAAQTTNRIFGQSYEGVSLSSIGPIDVEEGDFIVIRGYNGYTQLSRSVIAYPYTYLHVQEV